MAPMPLFIAGTPLGSWQDAAAPVLAAARVPDTVVAGFTRWHDDVVGTGARARGRLHALAAGKELTLTPAHVEALGKLAPGNGQPLVGADARACWTLDALEASFPQSRYLLFVDHPVRALAAWLAHGESDDPRAALQIWHAGARLLWRHAQRYGDRCLLVEADDARRSPAPLLDTCRRALGIEPVATRAPHAVGPEVDALAWALGEAVLTEDRASRDLYEELLAATTPLTEVDATRESLSLTSRLDAPAAAQRYRQLCDAQGENGRLLLRLHQVHAELEHYYRECESLEAGSSGPGAAGAQLEVEQCSFGAEQPRPPHRQLDVALHRVSQGQRSFDRMDVRLVHHLGCPGLLFFGAAGMAPPLSAWTESGQEGGRPFMLLIPAAPVARELLSRMGAADWGLVLDVVGRLERELRDGDTALRERWLAVAQRLLVELRHMPDRYRYDAVSVRPLQAEDAPAVVVTFQNVFAGDRTLEQVRLHWWMRDAPAADGLQASVVLLGDPGSAAPPLLDGWPVDESGHWSEKFAVPVGPQVDNGVKRRHWAGFSLRDRDILLALLDALSAVARVIADADVPARVTRTGLEAAARGLLRDARRSALGSPARRLAQALRRRLADR